MKRSLRPGKTCARIYPGVVSTTCGEVTKHKIFIKGDLKSIKGRPEEHQGYIQYVKQRKEGTESLAGCLPATRLPDPSSTISHPQIKPIFPCKFFLRPCVMHTVV